MPLLLAVTGCLETVFDITTDERLVRVPRSSKAEFEVDTGRIELPTKLGTDKVIERVVLQLEGTNLNEENPVTVDISAASSLEPNTFRPIATFDIDADAVRSIEVVQTDPNDALVLATQSDFVNIRFESRSPRPGIGEIEFRFTIRVLAHKRTPGTGAGTLLFF
ncbi:MAG: hypothetical protein R3326_02510 [Gemmatimonadota bacterium]|nr:hypothetical protein [Gemmatimonadota bacterium]